MPTYLSNYYQNKKTGDRQNTLEETNDNYEKYNAGTYAQTSDTIRKQLENFFAVHNRRLEKFLQMDFNW